MYRRFIAQDAVVFLEQAGNEPFRSTLTIPAIEQLARNPYAYTISRGERILAIAGLAEYWANRAEAWAMITDGIGMQFLTVYRDIRTFLSTCNMRRIEAAIPIYGKSADHRWLAAMGFACEAPYCRKFLPNGDDCALYARVL